MYPLANVIRCEVTDGSSDGIVSVEQGDCRISRPCCDYRLEIPLLKRQYTHTQDVVSANRIGSSSWDRLDLTRQLAAAGQAYGIECLAFLQPTTNLRSERRKLTQPCIRLPITNAVTSISRQAGNSFSGELPSFLFRSKCLKKR